MLNAAFSGMHRHTKPAAYADKKMKRRAVKAARPGSYGFSFSGEFPEAPDYMPVQATDRRRRYVEPSGQTGSYEPVGSDGTMRIPMVNRYGIRLLPAIVMLVLLASVLAGFVVMQYAENTRISKQLSAQTYRMDELAVEINATLNQITQQSNGVNIRQEAMRIGLHSSRGVVVEYLDVPADAVFGPDMTVDSSNMASVLGQ